MCKYLSLLLPFLLLTSCFTPKKERQFRDDMSTLNARMAKMEADLAEKDSAGSKRLANNASDVEKMQAELAKMKGEVDALKVGVTTGQMPGAPTQDGSVAQRLEHLGERITALEEGQAQILAAIEKGGKNNKAEKSISSLSGLRKAFEGNKHSAVAEDAPKLVKDLKGRDKAEALYLYSESLYKLGKFRDAALKFNELTELSEGEKYESQAKLRLGQAFAKVGDPSTAKIYFKEVVEKFPDSDEAKTAKKMMDGD